MVKMAKYTQNEKFERSLDRLRNEKLEEMLEKGEISQENYEIITKFMDTRKGLEPGTQVNSAWRLLDFFRFLKVPLDGIEEEDLQGFMNDARDKGKSTGYQNVYVKNIRCLSSWYAKTIKKKKPDVSKHLRDILEDSDALKKQKVDEFVDILSLREIRKILESEQHPQNQLICSLLWETGIRNSELVNLNLDEDLDTSRYDKGVVVKIRKTKNKKGRSLMIVDSVPFLQIWLDKHPLKNSEAKGRPLFCNDKGRCYGERFAETTINKIVKRAGENAAIGRNLYCHLLRHSCFTFKAANGWSALEIQQLAGHESIMMSQKYVHMSSEDLYRKILKERGYITEEESKEQVNGLMPKICPNCETSCPATAKICHGCGLIFGSKKQMEIQKEKQNLEERVMELEDLQRKQNELMEKLLGLKPEEMAKIGQYLKR